MENFAIYETRLGLIQINYLDNKISYLKKLKDLNIESYGQKNDLTDQVFEELEEYFAGLRKKFNFEYTLQGTDFQKKVWQALCDIPYGETRTYKEIAIAIGNGKACRAVAWLIIKTP